MEYLDTSFAAGKSGIILFRSALAFVVRRQETAASPDELSAFLGRRLAKYKIPKEYVSIDALPRTPYGKVIKAELTGRYLRQGNQP